MQIRTRLTIRFMFIVAGIMVIAMAYIYYAVSDHLYREFYLILRSKANLTAAVAIGRIESFESMPVTFAPEGRLDYYTENILIYNEENKLVYFFHPPRNPPGIEQLKTIRQKSEGKIILGNHHAQGQVFISPSGKQYVVVAKAFFDKGELENLLRTMLLIFLAMVALVYYLGWVFAGQALSPIRLVMNQVDAIHPSSLTQRLTTGKNKDEIDRLAETFNRLLERIHAAFTAQQQFLANISHELKNPFAIIASQAEIALNRERTTEEYKKTIQSIREEVMQVNEVSDQLMALSRIYSASDKIQMEPFRLDELVWKIQSHLFKSHPEYQVDIQMLQLPEEEIDLIYQMNEPLMRTALSNLVENACKFSPDHKAMVTFKTELEGITLDIEDSGPGIPDSDLLRIFDPYYRGQYKQHIKGSGIGLTLVASILQLHGVRIEVSNRQLTGCRFRLEFTPFHQSKELPITSTVSP